MPNAIDSGAPAPVVALRAIRSALDATKQSTIHTTEADAVEAARRTLGNLGGGELTTMGVKGKIVSKDTIKPGNDPNPPRDTEH